MRNIEDYAKNYIEPGFEDWQVKYRRKKVMEILESYKPERILEIGCGMDPMFQYADWNYCLWTVIEPSSLFCENARVLAENTENSGRVSVYHGVFSQNIMTEDEFDFIICSGLLHEVEDSKKFLLEIADICSKDTMVHINVPNANSFHRILAKNGGLIKDVHEFSPRNKQLQQSRVFDMELLKKELKDTGFSLCDCGSYFIKPFAHWQMYQMLKIGIINEAVLDGLYAISDKFKEYGSEIYINVKLAD